MTSVHPSLPVAPAGEWFERSGAGGGVTHITEPFVTGTARALVAFCARANAGSRRG